MKYVVIADDGELHVKDGTYEQARAEVGPPGWDRVRLPQTEGYPMSAGWVNGDGHPLGLGRNIIGGLVLTGMGAAMMPYAGPVVITGWDPYGMPIEVCDLTEAQITTILDCHTDARAAMAGEPGPLYERGREVAELMRTAPTPTVQVLSADEFFARTRGQS